MGDIVQQHRDRPPADDQHERDEPDHLRDRQRDACRQFPDIEPAAALARLADDGGDGRQQDQNEDHQQVLDDQPADRDMAALGLDQAPLLQGASQHDRTGDR